MLPIDLTQAIHASLSSDKPHSTNLYCSTDLVGSLRHAMLRAAGAPTLEPEFLSDIRLATGRFWHKHVGNYLVEQGIPFMQEVRLNKWLPEGWGGRADWLFWNEDLGGFALGDLKTMKGEAYKFIDKDGIKLEHLWQLSAYWHALEAAGIPLITGVIAYYLPMNNTQDRYEQPTPIIHEASPLPKTVVWEEMERRWAATKKYLEQLVNVFDEVSIEFPNERFINEHLAPEQSRIQKLWWNKQRGVFDVKLVKHWSADYCPYPDELCGCNTRGQEKIGEYVLEDGVAIYRPRKGYEDQTALVKPTPREVAKRWKEVNTRA